MSHTVLSAAKLSAARAFLDSLVMHTARHLPPSLHDAGCWGGKGMPSQSREPPRKLPPSPGKSPQTLSRVRLTHILSPEPHHRQESYLCSAGSPSAELPKPPMTRTAAPYPTFPQQQQQSSESTWIKPKKKKEKKRMKKKKRNQKGLETFLSTHLSKAIKP